MVLKLSRMLQPGVIRQGISRRCPAKKWQQLSTAWMYKPWGGVEYTQERTIEDSAWMEPSELAEDTAPHKGLGSYLGTVHEDWPPPSTH